MALLASLGVFLAVILLGMRSPAPQARLLQSQVSHWLPARPAGKGRTAWIEKALRLSGSRLGVRPFLGLMAAGSVLLFLIAQRIFGSPLIGLVIGSLGVVGPYMKLKRVEQERREKLALQFKEALTSIVYSLRSGASLQTAMERALLDLDRIFPGGATEPVVQEFEELVRQLRLGVPVEAVLSEWADRVKLEEVSDFVAATLAVKTRGGNLTEVMANISETISWKIVAQAQIRALTAEKRSEANLLTAAPSVILVMLSFLSPQYIAPLFNTGGGQVLLLIGITCNILAFFAVRKVLESPL